MSRGKLGLSEIMMNNKWIVDDAPHITVDSSKCDACNKKACVFLCPAGCYELEEGGKLRFNYEGCLECGTCRIICDKNAVKWGYPKGGHGIQYKYG